MRLIDVDELGVGRCSKDVLPAAYCAGWNGLLGLIEKAPTVDAVPVVRCTDCKYHDDYGVHFCNRLGMDCPDDSDFSCSYGKPKNGGDSNAKSV